MSYKTLNFEPYFEQTPRSSGPLLLAVILSRNDFTE